MSLSNSLSGVQSSNGTSSAANGSSLTKTNSVGSISFTGISSGLDTNAIISALLQADQVPITNLQNQQSQLQSQLQVIQLYATALQAFGSAGSNLNSASAFNTISATSSNTAAATIATTTGAAAGVYNLSITQLAQAQKIASSAQQNATAALNLSGTLVVNGHGVQVAGSDTLNDIAEKINGLNAGVTASVINGGSGSTYLTLTANSSGTANQIQIADLQGTVGASLGLITGAASPNEPTSGTVDSTVFASQSTDLATQLNGSSLSSDTFSINGVGVTVDPNTTSLQGLASAINAAGTGATASIVTGTDSNGNTTYNLHLTQVTSISDSGSLLAGIGALQQSYGNQILQAKDAMYSLDSVNLTSSSNTITNVIAGATINLLEGTSANPATTTLSLTQDTSQITSNIQNFVTAYNNLQTLVAQNSQLNTSTYATGALFGDANVQQIQGQLATSLFTPVAGLSAPYNNLAAIGMLLDQSGNLHLDTTQLQTALSNDPSAVSSLFQAVGSGSTSSLNYISSANKTVTTGNGEYAVNITQAATEGSFTASTAQTSPLAQSELLTFGGSLFGNTNQTLLLQQGESQQDVVNQINSDANLKNTVVASVQNGLLTITSKQYGANGNFTLSSDTSASSGSSGIQGGALTAGLDVAGTINGEAATGSGQYLTGNSGNSTTEGLQIQYTGAATGQVGSVTFNNGVGALVNQMVSSFTDPVSGLVTDEENTINQQISDIGTQITQLQTQESATQAQLQTEFANMETALAELQQQQSQLNAVLGTSSSSGSSSSGSGSSGSTAGKIG